MTPEDLRTAVRIRIEELVVEEAKESAKRLEKRVNETKGKIVDAVLNKLSFERRETPMGVEIRIKLL